LLLVIASFGPSASYRSAGFGHFGHRREAFVLVREMLLGIIHIPIRGAELFMAKDAFQAELIPAIQDIGDGGTMAE
jgi:hypothetical protein